jgi:hypothetical protein
MEALQSYVVTLKKSQVFPDFTCVKIEVYVVLDVFRSTSLSWFTVP